MLYIEQVHGLDVEYVGQWNENNAPGDYAYALRNAVAASELANITTVLDRKQSVELWCSSGHLPQQRDCVVRRATSLPGHEEFRGSSELHTVCLEREPLGGRGGLDLRRSICALPGPLRQQKL